MRRRKPSNIAKLFQTASTLPLLWGNLILAFLITTGCHPHFEEIDADTRGLATVEPAPDPASNLHWEETSPTTKKTLHAVWTPSASTSVRGQEIEVFSDDRCLTPVGAPLELLSGSTSSHGISAAHGNTYTFRIITKGRHDNQTYSVCSDPIQVMLLPPNRPAAIDCPLNPPALTSSSCTLTAATPPDPQGEDVQYLDAGSTCAATSVNAATGAVAFTAPVKDATCTIRVKSSNGALDSTVLSSAAITGTNRAPNVPSLVSCAAGPLGGSTGNTCTLSPAAPADDDGDSVNYSDAGSTCAVTNVSVLTGAVTFTAPAKNASCVIKIRAYDGLSYSGSASSVTITGQNNPPNTPSSLSCATNPAALSTDVTCSMTPAGPVDVDGDSVTYIDGGSTCSGVNVSLVTGAVTFQAPAKNATCVIRVKAHDGSALSNTVSSATITGMNNAPAIPASLTCPATPAAGSNDNTCTLGAAATLDLDSDSITYVDGGSTCADPSIDSSTGEATFTAPSRGASCLMKVKAYDGTLYSAAVSSALITGANNAPARPQTLTCPIAPVAESTNNSCTLTAASTPDADDDSVTYFNDGSTCADVIVNATSGDATFTAPAAGQQCAVKVKAYDGALYSAAVTSATISGSNNPPAVPQAVNCTTNPAALSIGNSCTLTAAVTPDPDGDSVSYADGGSTCTNVSVNTTSGAVTFTAPARGDTCVVKVKAYDGSQYSIPATSASITAQNNPPAAPQTVSCALSPVADSAGNTCTLTAAATPDLDGDPVTYVDGGSTCGEVSVDASSGNVTFTAPAKGASCTVKIKGYDGTAYGSATSSASITGGNRAPNTPSGLNCPASPASGSTGNTCTLTAASPADADGDPVTYADAGSTCGGISINGATGEVTFTAPLAGSTCSIKVKAHDGIAYSSLIAATIGGANNPPSAPQTLSCNTAPVAGSSGNTCTLTAASPLDPDGDSVSYANGGSTCADTSVDGTTGAVTFTAPAKAGTCVIKVKAFDGQAYSSAITSGAITGQNNAPATPQSLTCETNPPAGSTGRTCTLTPAGTPDPDGESVTYVKDAATTCAGTSVSSDGTDITFTAPTKAESCVVVIKAFDGVAYSSALSSAVIHGENNAPNVPQTVTCNTSPLAASTGNSCTLTAANPADPDGDPVTYSDDGSTCPSVSVNPGTGAATYSAPAKGDSCVVKIKASDGALSSASRSSATITAANNAPLIPASLTCNTTPGAGSTGNTCTLTAANPTDLDGDTVTYVKDNSSTCASTSVSADGNTITFTAPARGSSCIVAVKAFDGTAYSSIRTSSTITGANNPPATPASLSCDNSPAAQSSGNTCTLTPAGTPDADGEAVTYVKDSATTCASTTVSPDGSTITFTAPLKNATCVVVIKAYDGSAYSSTITSGTITGQNRTPNTPAAIDCPTSPNGGSTGNACTLTAANPADPDLDAVTYADAGSTCGAANVNSYNGATTFTAPAGGNTCVVKVKAFDGTAYSGVVTSATISPSNSAPAQPAALTCPTGPGANTAGNTCTLTPANPADPNGDPVTYSKDPSTTCPSTSVSADGLTITFTAPARDNSCRVAVRAYDGTSYSTAVSSAGITGQNNPPNTPQSISCPATALAFATGLTCTFTPAAVPDVDGDPVSYTGIQSTCNSVVVNSATRTVTFNGPSRGGSCAVRVAADDGIDESPGQAEATITGVNNPPYQPAAVNCPTTPLAKAANLSCSVTAANPKDKDGDSVQYFDDGSTCTVTSLTSSTGAIEFTAPAKGASCDIKIKARDASLSYSTPATTTITGQNNPPTKPVTLNCNTTPFPGTPGVACTLTAANPTDIDGDPVTYLDGGSTCPAASVDSVTGNATFTAPAGGENCLMKVKVNDGSADSPSVISETITGTALIPVELSINADRNNYDIFAEAGSPTDPVAVTVRVQAGAKVGDSARLGWAMKTGTFPATSTIRIINEGSILGAGGNGGNGGTSGTPCTAGGNGGAALYLTWPVTITNAGTISGGGGGGGGGPYLGGAPASGGGGGGAGYPAGQGGSGTNQAGQSGTLSAGGAGGDGGQTWVDGCPYGGWAAEAPGGRGGAPGKIAYSAEQGCAAGRAGNAVLADSLDHQATWNNVTSIAAGYSSICVTVDGGVKCMGDNASGLLGNGTNTNSRGVWVQAIAPNSGATRVSGRLSHYCAIVNEGVKCWGSNSDGQLGNNTQTGSNTPVEAIPAGSGVTVLSAGTHITCAIANGGIKCWGQGALKAPMVSFSKVPLEILSPGSGATDVSVGNDHTCAVVNGGVRCWGWSGSGQLGTNTTQTSYDFVYPIAAGSGATAVSAGQYFTCAVINGGVQCWGRNDAGQLGNNSKTDSLVPVQTIPANSGVTAVYAGYTHSCAVANSGVLCWGAGTGGKLGNNSAIAESLIPYQTMPAGSGAIQVAPYDYTCSVARGTLHCWGQMAYLEPSGSAGTHQTLVPMQMPGVNGTVLGNELHLPLSTYGY